MFEQLFSGIKSGLSTAGSGISSLFSNLFNAQQPQSPVMSGIPQPTVSAQTLSATPQNGRFLNLLNDLAGQYSRAERDQDLYNVLPADEASQVISNQRLVGMKEAELKREEANRQALRDVLRNPSDSGALARLEQIATITGDPTALERYLVASGKGGSSPAVLQVADALFNTLPVDQRTPEEYNRIIQMVGKYNEKGTFYDFGDGINTGYQPVPGATPGIASPITPQMPQAPQGITLPSDSPLAQYNQILEPPALDGVINVPAAAPSPATAPQIPQPVQTGAGIRAIPGANEAAAARVAAEERAKLEQQLNLNPQIATAEQQAKYIQSGFESLPKIQRSLTKMESANKNIDRIIGDVRASADKAFTTGFSGSVANYIAGSEGADMKKNIDTLLANSAFSALQQMRADSPTGGALGAVSERELDLLQSSYTNILNSQSKPQFLANLKAFEEQSKRSLELAKQAYKEDYARFGGARDPNLPPPQQTVAPAPRTESSSAEASSQLRQMGRAQIVEKLRQKGVPQAEIEQFLLEKGL